MFNENFTAELTSRIGSMVEVATDNMSIDGILSGVSNNLIVVHEVNDGYGDSVRTFVPVSSINFTRFTTS